MFLRRPLAVALIGVCAGSLLSPPAFAQTFTIPSPGISASTNQEPQGRRYPGDPATEAALVEAEDLRITDVRTMTSRADWNGVSTAKPYRLPTPRITFVLVPRKAPYTLGELARISPASVAETGGAYLAKEHIAVLDGATLVVRAGETVRLASDSSGFSSIVTLGGTLRVEGSDDAPATFTSWDVAQGVPDTDTSDGRAYLRVIGGRTVMTNVRLDALGFWSGRTGGFALTGENASAPAAPPTTQPTSGVAPLQPDRRNRGPVSADLRGLHISGAAYGLFMTNTDSVTVTSSTMDESLISGIVLHRGVRGARLENTRVSGSYRDGIVVARGASGVTATGTESTENGRNGITLDGRPFTQGPSVRGGSVSGFGDHTVTGGLAARNGRYGIEVTGGHGSKVHSLRVVDNHTGIVVGAAATDISLLGNQVSGAHKQAISVRDGVTDTVVRENSINGAGTAIYVRHARATIERNVIEDATSQGIVVVGQAEGTLLIANSVSGRGRSALDLNRATGVTAEENTVDEWVVTRSLAALAAWIFKPLSVVWLGVVAAPILTVRARRRARRRGLVDPFAAQAPLSAYTRGVVERVR